MHILTAAVGLLSLWTAAAADAVLAPRLPLKSLGVAFETAAGEFDLATEISEGVCDKNRPVTCTFVGEGRLEILGAAETVDSPPNKIALRYRDRGLAWVLPLNVGLLVSIVEPGMDRDDRYALTMRILDLAGQAPSRGIVDGLATRFTVAEIEGQTVITAEPAPSFIRRD